MARGDDCCYLCNECPNSFATLDELESHMAMDHLAKKSASSQGPSYAKQESIDEDTDIKMDLDMNECDENMAEHSPTSSDSSNMSDGDEKFSTNGSTPSLFVGARIAGHSCRICGRAFNDRGQLNVHYTHTHRDKPQYECEHCQAVFCVKRELSTHLRIHSGEQPHKCEICGKEFGTRQLLKKHNMWHSGERNHQCPTCGKAFFQKGHLTQHLMIHKGGRPHRCTQCEKTFIFKFDLNRHMKIHVERGHSCSKCGKSFLKQSSLEEHANKCKGTIASPQIDSTRTSTPISDISRHESPTPVNDLRKLSNTSVNVSSSSPTIHSPFQMLSNIIKHENSPAEATVAPIQNNVFNSQLLMSQFNQDDQFNTTAQNLISHYNEQNQQRLLMMTAAQRLLGMGQNALSTQNNIMNGLYCNICNKNYQNAAAFTIHWSLIHLKNNNIIQQNEENELKLNVNKSDEMLNVHSDSATSSSCASSPQKISPISHTDSEHKYCDQCDIYRQKVTDLEKELEKANEEATKMRETMRRFNALAGTLLGTQNQGTFEMDKLWAFPCK